MSQLPDSELDQEGGLEGEEEVDYDNRLHRHLGTKNNPSQDSSTLSFSISIIS